MSSAPTITVLTCVRNGAQYIAETIESVRAQTFGDWEYVLVDDASDDETPRIIAEHASLDGRVRYVRRETAGGPYVAANHGLDVATGRYVMRIDADDLATPERMAVQLAYLERSPGIRACLGAWRSIDGAGTPSGQIRRLPSTSQRVLRWSLCVVSGVVHSTALVERAAFEEVGRYAPYPTSADLKLWCDLSRREWLGATDDLVAFYRRHDEQITNVRTGVQRQYAWKILQEHLGALTDEPWSLDDVAAVFAPGRWDRTSFRHGSEMLDRWERAWRSDHHLTDADRRELRTLTLRVRLRHIRMNRGSVGDAIRGTMTLLPRRTSS